MNSPDFEAARAYALQRLEIELDSQLVYHSFGHTWDEVVPAAERLAEMEEVDGEGLLFPSQLVICGVTYLYFNVG